ncbi:MAG: hypothetical protein M3O67_01190, partial [Bacteroidota bacterium]|nr:hypothetical protein [Bacteroidota bacterium]
DSLMAYIEWVELESFFSGYLLIYAIIYLMASNRTVTNFVKSKLLPKLSLAYAFVGILYWGLQLKNAYPDYHINHLIAGVQFHYLKIWGLLSIFFWIPLLNKRAVFCLLHSLVFFFLLIKSFYLQLSIPSGNNDLARNNIKIYSVSILLNLIALILVTLISLLIARFKRQKRSTHI